MSDYIPEEQGPCIGVKCDYDADCVVRGGRPKCECPACTDLPFDPVSSMLDNIWFCL